MSVRRVVPDIVSDRVDDSRAFFVEVLGFDVGMDMGWIVTLVSPDNPTAQVSLFPRSDDDEASPNITVEVDDVDAVHDAAARAGHDIIYGITDEDWGVRRFFVREPGGAIVNVMSHGGA